jgi:hypothetical protein
MTRYPFQCVLNATPDACATFITGSILPTTTNPVRGCVCPAIGSWYTDLNPLTALASRCVNNATCPATYYADYRVKDGTVVRLGCRDPGVTQLQYTGETANFQGCLVGDYLDVTHFPHACVSGASGCPAGSIADTGSKTCKCNANYYPDLSIAWNADSACRTRCPAGTFINNTTTILYPVAGTCIASCTQISILS